jgi:hypothetical protein
MFMRSLSEAPLTGPRTRVGYEEAPAGREPRVARRFGFSACSASSRFSSALARCSRFAAAFSSVRLLAAASSASASRSSLAQYWRPWPPRRGGAARTEGPPRVNLRKSGPRAALVPQAEPAGKSPDRPWARRLTSSRINNLSVGRQGADRDREVQAGPDLRQLHLGRFGCDETNRSRSRRCTLGTQSRAQRNCREPSVWTPFIPLAGRRYHCLAIAPWEWRRPGRDTRSPSTFQVWALERRVCEPARGVALAAPLRRGGCARPVAG